MQGEKMQFMMIKLDKMGDATISTILMKNSWKLRRGILRKNWTGLLEMSIFLKNRLKVRNLKNIGIKWNSALEMR